MKKDISEEKKNKLAVIWAIICIVCSVLIWCLTIGQSDIILPVFMGAAALLYGPITAFLYLREVKNGVFSVEDEDEEESAEMQEYLHLVESCVDRRVRDMRG